MDIIDHILLILWIGFTSCFVITGGYGIIKRNFYFPSRKFNVKRYKGSSAVIWGLMIAFIGLFFTFIQCWVIFEKSESYIGIIGLLLGIFFSILSQKLYKKSFK